MSLYWSSIQIKFEFFQEQNKACIFMFNEIDPFFELQHQS